jgi:hypothetical protein
MILVHSAVCLKTGPQLLPKRVLHSVRSSASSFIFQYPPFSLSLFGSSLHLLPRLSFYHSSIFPSITCLRRQSLRYMWPIKLAFLLFYCTSDIPLLFYSKQYFFISHAIGPTDNLHPSPAPHFKTFQVFVICFCTSKNRRQGSVHHNNV